MSYSVCNCCQSNCCEETMKEMEFMRGLFGAALTGNTARVKQLLEKGADPRKRDDSGYTALHYAARHGKIEICEALLNHNADSNAQTPGGATALQRAAYCDHANIVELLLKFHADPMLSDSDGKTALHKAAEGQSIACAKLLLENCCESLKEVLDKRGRPPVYYVDADQEELKQLLS